MKPVKKTKALLKYINQVKAHYNYPWYNKSYDQFMYTEDELFGWYESYKTNVLKKYINDKYVIQDNWKKKKTGSYTSPWAIKSIPRRIINPEVQV